MRKYIGDKDAMEKVSRCFVKRSNCVLKGVIDYWIVRIVRHSRMRDGVRYPTIFFSRKGFFSLSIQCIVDDRNIVLWVSYSQKGGLHDFNCFRKNKLYKSLGSVRGFILGDSAYAVKSFLIPPYNSPNHRTPKDEFNFYVFF